MRLLIFLTFSILVTFIFVMIGTPDGDSAAYNLAWITGYEASFGWRTPLPRFLPSLFDGLGGHDMFFYGPLPFAIEAILAPACFGCDVTTKLALTGAALLIMSSITCYFFLREFFAAWPATIGAIFYSLLPYHLLIDWFLRQAIAEFAAYIFIPLISLGFHRICSKRGGGPWIVLGVAGCVMSHLPTALLAAHIFGIAAIAYMFGAGGYDSKRLNVFFQLGGWAILGMALAAFYWIPALTLLDSVSAHTLYQPYYNAQSWLYGFGFNQPNPALAQIILICFMLPLPIAALGYLVSGSTARFWIAVPIAIVIAANHQISAPLWQHWIIDRVQFPFRLLVFADLSFAISASGLIAFAIKRASRTRTASYALVLVSPLICYMMFIGIPDTYEQDAQDDSHWLAPFEYLSPEMAAVLVKNIGNRELYKLRLPAARAEIRALTSRHPTPQKMLVGSGRRWQVIPQSETVRFPVPIQYWQFWTAHDFAGDRLATQVNESFGTLDILANADGFDGQPVTVTLPYHPSEKLGFLVSAIALLGLIRSAALHRRNIAKHPASQPDAHGPQ